ncbi:hypothetical protein HDV00_012694 [Rhizophlyctis rosea]|nr:hypothetical protein HDV00_012694 [Rhizophlyctis rosea]
MVRDVATLWYAWSQPWNPSSLPDVRVEEVDFGETLRRTGDGVVRDLIWSMPLHSWDTDVWIVNGVRADGQVIMCEHYDGDEENADGSYGGQGAFSDSIFVETIPCPVQYIFQNSRHVRTDTLLKLMPDQTLRLADWKTGDDIRNINEDDSLRFFYFTDTIIFNTIFQSWRCRNDSPSTGEQVLSSLQDYSTVFAFDDSTSKRAYNSILVAQLHRESDAFSLTLTRIADNTELFFTPIDTSVADSEDIDICLNRFNVILLRHWCCRVEVFDFHGTKLYTFSTTYDNPYTNPTIRRRPVEMFELDDFLLVTEDKRSRDRREQEAGNKLVIFDPKQRTKQSLVMSRREESLILRRWRQGLRPWLDKSAPEDQKLRDTFWGHWVALTEYPVNEDGRRTGAGGKVRILWRWRRHRGDLEDEED